MRYLRNSHEIRQELASLFSGTGDKWAIVAFVGYNALDHLPSAVNCLSVVCWPKAGGTNPDGVRRLIDKGIPVFFCDRLHQKIYWCEDAGLIVGSANLSENALGDDRLHEFAVVCDDKGFDIKDVLGSLNYTRVTPEALARLDVEHVAEARKRRGEDTSSNARTVPTFLASLDTNNPKRWKIITWTEERESNEEVQAEVESHFGTRNWVTDNDVESDSFEAGDFVLQVRTNDDGIIQRANAKWMVVDHLIRKKAWRAVVQVTEIDGRALPPFQLDSAFMKNLKHAFNAKDWGDIHDKDYVVHNSFLTAVKELYPGRS